jgi:cytochrome c oxidase cbb3-type subunit 3
MFRAHGFYLAIGLVLLCGCSQGGEDSTPAVASETVHAESWRESRLLAGKEIYDAACASCHDQGEGDAPSIGDRDAWSGRSDLWTAVLASHASNGYFKMPEKGGHGELSDEDVSAAVEYMLQKTFPEMPRD